MNQHRADVVRILAVDDEPHILDLFQEILSFEMSPYSFELTFCSSADEAVEAVRLAIGNERPFAVAFVDVRLSSGQDGVWAAEQIRTLDPNIEIVIVTAYGDVSPEEFVSRISPARKLLYFSKPFTPEEIKQCAVALSAKWHQEIQLDKIHSELESRVEERTTDLQIANAQLKQEIEQRNRADAELRESEARYRGIFEHTSNGVVVYEAVDGGRDFIILDFNAGAEEIEEIKRDAVIGRSVLEVFPGVKDLGLFELFQRVWAAGRAEHHPVSLYKDERIVGWRENFVYKLPSGEIVAVYSDVTERKKAEEELRESEERYRTLFKNNHSAMLLVDPESGEIVDANPAACSFYGWSHQDLTGKRIMDINTLTAEEVFQEMASAQTEKRQHFYFHHRLANEESRDVEVYSGPIRLHGKELLCSIIHDITERKQTEAALRESEERYRTVLEANPDPVVVYDIEGKVIYFNPAFTRVFGWSLEERLGKKMDVFVPEETWSETKMMIGRVLAGESFSGVETRRYTKDEKIIPVSISGAIYRDGAGNPVGSVINLRDISEQKKLEAQLQQAQKMEAVGTLAGGVAHDFNNLLQAIQGYTELLLIRKKEGESGWRELQEVLRAAKRGGELTQQLLTFSRKVDSKKQPVDLNQQVEELRDLLKRTIPKMIEVKLQLSDNLQVVNGDPVQLKQLLMNLALNAKDAMPDGGTLVIETESVTLDQEFCRKYAEVKPGDFVQLRISDTGHGMDRETLAHIFDPFYTTKETGKGTGLGLAIVYGITKNHDGYIMCYSQPQEGTSFKLYLPVLRQELSFTDMVDAEEPGVPMKGGNETILLVDDEEFIRALGVDILGQAGYDVLTAADGESALELIHQKKGGIDLVILDLIMPGMGGSKCLEELLKVDPQAKVLIASGYSPDSLTKGILETGAKGFINKPYDTTHLLELVREILDKK